MTTPPCRPSQALFFVRWQPFEYGKASSSAHPIACRVGNIYKLIANSFIHCAKWLVNGMLGTYYAWTGRIVVALDEVTQKHATDLETTKTQITALETSITNLQEELVTIENTVQKMQENPTQPVVKEPGWALLNKKLQA